MYDVMYNWAYAVGCTILKNVDGENLLRKLIFDIRGESLPGRFLEKLSGRLTEYKINRNIAIDVSIHPKLFEAKLQADSFHYAKSAILSGFLNSLSFTDQKKSKGEQDGA